MFRKLLVLSSVCFLPIPGYAQSNDLAISAGAMFSPDSGRSGVCPTVVGGTCVVAGSARAGFSLEGTFAHRLLNLHLASLHLELPLLGTPNRTSPSTSYSAIFFTPGLKVKFSLPAFSPRPISLDVTRLSILRAIACGGTSAPFTSKIR